MAARARPIPRDEAVRLIRDHADTFGRPPLFVTRLGPERIPAYRLVQPLGAQRWSEALLAALGDHPLGDVVRRHRAHAARYSDEELRGHLVDFTRERGNPLRSRRWEEWAAEGVGRPHFGVIKRRLDADAIKAITGLTLDTSRAAVRKQRDETRRRGRAALRELAGLLGRAPRRVELRPEWLSSHPDARVRNAAAAGRWPSGDEIYEAYGSWPAALADAGLAPLPDDEAILVALLDYRQRFGFWPKRTDVALDRARRHPTTYELRTKRYREWGGPSDSTINAHFGQVANAVTAARARWPEYADDEPQAITPARAEAATPFHQLGTTQRELLSRVLYVGRVLELDVRRWYGPTRARMLCESLTRRGLLERDDESGWVSVPAAMQASVRDRVGVATSVPEAPPAPAPRELVTASLAHALRRLERGDADHVVIAREAKRPAVLLTASRYEELLRQQAPGSTG